MEIMHTAAETKPQTEEHLPWHMPEIQLLTISLDTGDSVGSFSDGPAHERVARD